MDLRGATLEGTILTRANLRGANLFMVEATGPQLQGCKGAISKGPLGSRNMAAVACINTSYSVRIVAAIARRI